MQAITNMVEGAQNALVPTLVSDTSRLQEIFDLRVSAWELSGKSHIVNRQFFPQGWRDELDCDAHHWMVTNEHDHIIAAARLNVFQSCDQTSHCAVSRCSKDPHKGTCGFFGRLVIHPDYQRQSLGMKLINARLDYCYSNKINWLQALVTSEDVQRVLTRLDFKIKGQVDVNYHEFTPPHAVNVFVKECQYQD